MKTFATLFSGGEGVGVGLQAAGLAHLWGVEYDAAIAAVAQANGFDVTVADVRDVDYAAMPRADWLHASPSCTRASVANANATEAQEDIDAAKAVCRALDAQQPEVFTLENVWGYRTFAAFRLICDQLGRMGYFWTYSHENAADYGGIISCPLHEQGSLIASAPSAGKCSNPDFPKGIAPDIAQIIAMMPPADQARHLAWDAVAHLVRAIKRDTAVAVTFQELASSMAANKALRTPHGKEEFVSMNADMFASASMANIDASIAWLLNLCSDAPLLREKWCITSMETRRTTIRLILLCFLTIVPTFQSTTKKPTRTIQNGESDISGTANECPLCRISAVPQTRRRLILRAARGLLPHLPTPVPWVGWYAAIEDLIPTLPESKLAPWQLARLPEELRGSVLVGGGNTQLGQVDSKARQADEPMFTVTSATKMGDNRAVLVPGLLNSDCTTMTTRDGDAWSVTVTTSHNQRDMRAVLVDIANTPRDATVIEPDAPAMTVQAWHGRRPSQAPLAVFARVVSMTPRALARFQSVPDTYRLPEKRTLAAKVIGNMVPPLLMQRIAGNMLEALG